MLNLPFVPPSFYWLEMEASEDLKVKDWIVQSHKWSREVEKEAWDAILFGVPLSRSSISVSGASEFPEHFRRAWKSFSTYNLDYEVELSQLKVLDVGDVPMHITDIKKCHDTIRHSISSVKDVFPGSLPIGIGGDHSITAMLVSGLKDTMPEKEIGILQFDTHLDLRDLKENGPTNGTPIRNLIERGAIKGENVYNIGLHGFFNGQSLIKYAKENHVNYITLKQAREKGISETVKEVLKSLESKVDVIYVTIDMDVLDISSAPGVPASTPGGMWATELFEAVYLAGSSQKVGGMDIVCLDPTKDTPAQQTVKTGVYTFLTFLTGFLNQKQ